MSWVYDYLIRPIISTAAWFLGSGYSRSETQERLEAPPHLVAPQDATIAIAEAERARYFAEFIRQRPGGGSFGKEWFAAARGAWYAGYGRAPTPEERPWAFTRPQGMLGLMVRVTGMGEWSREQKSRTVTINAPWSATWSDVVSYVEDMFATGGIHLLVESSEPMDVVSVELVGGALLERQDPTFTLP
jgi:hypothetical protein